ncbi:MAG: sigma-70 family RNA polymerase sigma factor [Patescibacteria group bacterium]|nr:sigma-70 family RNA polymerase sigma factor [Patescibacteria group bacterium]MDE2015406.1 sigma-70 family RNA polymerase sigma factor [Patescibacteria group bacterium]MDE2226979.1 sigma-70 family RNA polymerase sigma factor [Patescibacteria group bacterium]
MSEKYCQSESDAQEMNTITKAQMGDESAFTEIYKKYHQRIFRLFMRIAGNHTDAEDFLQEAFMQVFKKIGQFRGESKFSTWLYRVAVNQALMELRKKRIVTIPLVDLQVQLLPNRSTNTRGGIIIEPKFDHEAKINHHPGDIGRRNTIELRLCLKEAIEKLPDGYKDALVLHDVEGYEHNEIAGMRGSTIGNSKSQLHKARRKLRGMLKTEACPPRTATVTA